MNYRLLNDLTPKRIDSIICLHCKKIDIDIFENEEISKISNGDLVDIICGYCDKNFKVEIHIDICYSTYRQ